MITLNQLIPLTKMDYMALGSASCSAVIGIYAATVGDQPVTVTALIVTSIGVVVPLARIWANDRREQRRSLVNNDRINELEKLVLRLNQDMDKYAGKILANQEKFERIIAESGGFMFNKGMSDPGIEKRP